jgi:uncharacterized protein
MKIKFLIILLLIATLGWSQTKPKPKVALEKIQPEKKVEVRVIGRVQKNKILLRWAVTEALAWKKCNKYGYQLERYTITRDGKILEKPEKLILSKNIAPEPLGKWEKVVAVDKNENAGIIAQAIYGKSFAVKGEKGLQAIINESEESVQRFTYALFASDHDFEIAKKAGLGYEDTSVKANEKYLYRVISNVPVTEMPIEYGGAVLTLSEYADLPKPMDFLAIFKDKETLLSWNFKDLMNEYGSYNIERSTDKKNFTRLNAKPYTSMNVADNGSRIFYTDSITNGQQYSYRIQGISAFGELGPYSEVLSGTGKSVLKYTAHLTTQEFKNDKVVKLSWEFPNEGTPEIESFELNRADEDDAQKYEMVLKNIPAASRSVVYDKLKASNYFTITAIGKNGDKTTSFPLLVQPIDSIPPAKPMGLKGTIDKTGVVKLNWTPNTENDLMGYRIYKSYNPKAEFVLLTGSTVAEEVFTETIPVKNSNSNVYYKISAVDNRYNTSPESEVLVLKKPDITPPSAPVFIKYVVKNNQIQLQWANSNSANVVAHYLYRSTNNQNPPQLLAEIKDKTDVYTDAKATEGNQYSYTIVAKSESGLESLPSPALGIALPKVSLVPEIKGFYAQINANKDGIELSWKYKQAELDHFELYKAIQGKPLQILLMPAFTTKTITDTNLTINTNYHYAIRAVYKDGRMSKMSEYTIKF